MTELFPQPDDSPSVLAIADEAIERRCPLLRGASPEVAERPEGAHH
jgi:hypothetical protein